MQIKVTIRSAMIATLHWIALRMSDVAMAVNWPWLFEQGGSLEYWCDTKWEEWKCK